MASSNIPTTGGDEHDIATQISSTPTVETLQSRRTAEIWQHFTEIMVDGVPKAKCNICNKLFSTGGNSTLKRHHATCSKRLAPESSQAQIDNTGHIWTYDQALQRELQMKWLIKKSYPFNAFDDATTTSYIQQGLQPKYQRVSRTTITRDAHKAYLTIKKDLIKFFASFDGRVSLTSDVWTCGIRLGISYICITCHWIDSSTYEMCKRIICFDTFEYPHTGLAIYQVIMSCIREYKLKEKILSISFDNASNNTSAIEYLKRDLNPILNGVFLHTRCVCHILNLIVQSGLEYVQPYITKIRDLLSFVFTSKKRRQDFKKFAHSQGENFLKPEFDMPVRWNSTFKMLKIACQQKRILMEFYNSIVVEHIISNEDWYVIETLLQLLEVFYTSTVKLSGVYYPTSPLVLPELLNITNIFKEFKQMMFWEPLILVMQEKFKKYFEDMPPIFCCAAALNLTIGYDGVQYLLELIADNLEIDSSLQENANFSSQTFSEVFTSLYQLYDSLYGSRPRDHFSSVSSSSTSSRRLFDTLARKKSKTTSSINELGVYQNTDFMSFMTSEEFENFNLLDWWKNNSGRYPVMAAMARDILTVQASTVASESAFSLSGRILNEKRSRLSAQSLEICICYKDYLDSVERQQDRVSIESTSDEDLLVESQDDNEGGPSQDQQ